MHRDRKNTLFIMVGLPGSGKSTISRELANRTGAVHLESDAIRREMFPERSYSRQESQRVFNRIRFDVFLQAEAGKSVIVDATFLTERDRAPFLEKLAQEFDRVLVVVVETPEALCKHRLDCKTAENLSEATADIYETMKRKIAWDEVGVMSFGEFPVPHIRVFGTVRPEINVDAILEAVG